MSDKIFIDTHIWLYALIESDHCLEKHHKARQCIAAMENIIISTQVVNQVCVNLLRKGNTDMPYKCLAISHHAFHPYFDNKF